MPSIGVIGTGSRGMDIIRICSKHGALGGVADISALPLRALAQEFPDLRPRRGADAIFRSNVDAVAIATPAATRVELALRAIHYGKHVFVDGPLSMSEEGAVAVTRKADRAGLKVFVGHKLLHHPAIVAQRTLVQDGTLGDVVHVRARHLALESNNGDEGVWWRHAPDHTALVIALMGEPMFVSAAQQSCYNSDKSEFLYAHLQFSRQRSAHIEISCIDPVGSSRVDVFGSKGVASAETSPPLSRLTLQINSHHHANPLEGAPGEELAQHILTYAETEPPENEFLAFVEALSDGTASPNDGVNRIFTARVLEALTRAARSHSAEYLPNG